MDQIACALQAVRRARDELRHTWQPLEGRQCARELLYDHVALVRLWRRRRAVRRLLGDGRLHIRKLEPESDQARQRVARVAHAALQALPVVA